MSLASWESVCILAFGSCQVQQLLLPPHKTKPNQNNYGKLVSKEFLFHCEVLLIFQVNQAELLNPGECAKLTCIPETVPALHLHAHLIFQLNDQKPILC